MKYQNNIFLDTLQGNPTQRPPVWLMRQAGRILPEYRAVRASVRDFKELVKTPDLAAEVTIQPVDILGVDAAIIFSDILVIPEAMGLSYEMIEAKGPFFPKTIQSKSDIEQLISGEMAAEQLQYVYDAIKLTKQRLNGRVPVIGFAGAPWTILAYMIEGGGSKTFSNAKRLLYKEPKLAHQLLQKIADSTIIYLQQQRRAGVELVQLFDSWAGILNKELYQEFCIPYLQQIVEAIKPNCPITIFAKDAWFALSDIAQLQPTVIGLDWTISGDYANQLLSDNIIRQGNLDPCVLYADEETIRNKTEKMLQSFKKQRYIVNLGHGLYPDTPVEQVKLFIEIIKKTTIF